MPGEITYYFLVVLLLRLESFHIFTTWLPLLGFLRFLSLDDLGGLGLDWLERKGDV